MPLDSAQSLSHSKFVSTASTREVEYVSLDELAVEIRQTRADEIARSAQQDQQNRACADASAERFGCKETGRNKRACGLYLWLLGTNADGGRVSCPCQSRAE